VDGSKCFEKGRNQNRLRDEDVEAILAAYRTGADPDGDGGVPVRLVSHPEIEASGWDLNIGRYLKGAAAEVVDVAVALAELAKAQLALHEAEDRLAERLREAGYA
jgi:type I restriction enzyme M protein